MKMGGLKLSITVLLIAVGISHGLPQNYLFDTFEEVDSEEYGQYAGEKSTNCSCGWTNKENGRIVGGRETYVNEFPHMVAIATVLSDGRYNQFCGASILTPYHALTAAHCTEDETQQLVLITGEHDTTSKSETPYTKVYNVVNVIQHKDYDGDTYANDIALLVTDKKMAFNNAVGPICLPTKPMNSFLVDEIVKVTGWGDKWFNGRGSTTLLKVNLKVIPLKDCVPKYKGHDMSVSKPNQFCTYRSDKDSCQGDSGGPVTWLDPETNRYTLVGLVSFGDGCASDYPGVNTDVFAHMGWIQKNIRKTSSSSSVKTCAKSG